MLCVRSSDLYFEWKAMLSAIGAFALGAPLSKAAAATPSAITR
jgi:hypothetical protein